MIITISEKENIVIFRLKGEFISPSIGKVLETVEQTLCGRISSPKLVFDFKKVTRIDAAGLGTLMKISAEILPCGGRIAVINMNKHVRDITIMTRLNTVLECYKCENDAVTALLGHSYEMLTNSSVRYAANVKNWG